MFNAAVSQSPFFDQSFPTVLAMPRSLRVRAIPSIPLYLLRCVLRMGLFVMGILLCLEQGSTEP